MQYDLAIIKQELDTLPLFTSHLYLQGTSDELDPVEPTVGANYLDADKSEEKYYGYIKSFLKYLNCLPAAIPELDLKEITTDHRIDTHLKELK